MQRRIRAEIDLDALRYNHGVAMRLAGDRAVWPVVKADAYGHGMVTVAQALDQADGFCVADIEEALALRSAGIRAPVLVLQGAWDGESLHSAIDAGVSLAVHDEAQVALVEAHHGSFATTASTLWLKVDTGMHRLGVDPVDAPALRARLRAVVGADRVGVMTHFACADEAGHPLNEVQRTAFAEVMREGGAASACNSAALLTDLYGADTMVRPGIMLYGATPLLHRPASELDLVPVMTLRSRIIAVKTVPAGESVGYGATWVAAHDTRIGIVAAGYGDGYPRHAPSGTPVRIGSALAATVGRVSMDSIAVDLTHAPEAQLGSAVVLWGERLSVDEIAAAAGTIGYEVLTRIPPRVPRVPLDRRGRARSARTEGRPAP